MVNSLTQLTNQVEASNGANILWGTDGNDSLIGTAEDNVLIGRAGKDNLSGGPGKNSFLFQSLKDSLLPGFGPDRIRNLKIDTDIIGGPNPVAASKVLKAGRISKLTTREIRRVLRTKTLPPIVQPYSRLGNALL